MREGWTYVSFGDIMTPAKVERCGDRIDLPILSITMRSGIILQNDRFKKKIASFDTKDYKIVKNGQLVIAFPIDEGLIYTQDITDQGIMSPAYSIWDVDYSNLNRRFLGYLFHSPFAMNYYKSKLRGTTQRRRMLPKEDLLSFPIPVPPLSEQQRIVSELDLLSSIIEKKKAQLKEYDQLAQSIFYDMFGDLMTNEKGWEVKKLGEVAKEKLSYGSGASAIHYNNEVRYVRITDIKDDGELNSDMVSPNIYDEKYLLNDGDILFARSGATVGKTFLYKGKYGKCIYAGYLIRLIPNTKIVLPSYIYGFTKSSYYRSFVAKVQNAVAQPNINAKQYSELSIPLPPLPLQQSFASKIEAIERQKALVQQSITETETLFNSRMDYYFD